jgi:predicted unusual protein kinase regulating ubiquinone biosynthesis (AarF/ABC1/UbiB family)
LGQVYKGKLRTTGEDVAVKVQRPFVLETVSLDLYLLRNLGLQLRKVIVVVGRGRAGMGGWKVDRPCLI